MQSSHLSSFERGIVLGGARFNVPPGLLESFYLEVLLRGGEGIKAHDIVRGHHQPHKKIVEGDGTAGNGWPADEEASSQ